MKFLAESCTVTYCITSKSPCLISCPGKAGSYKQPLIQQIAHTAFHPLGVRQHFPSFLMLFYLILPHVFQLVIFFFLFRRIQTPLSKWRWFCRWSNHYVVDRYKWVRVSKNMCKWHVHKHAWQLQMHVLQRVWIH
jgi:hypothetical protein